MSGVHTSPFTGIPYDGRLAEEIVDHADSSALVLISWLETNPSYTMVETPRERKAFLEGWSCAITWLTYYLLRPDNLQGVLQNLIDLKRNSGDIPDNRGRPGAKNETE